MAIGIGQIHVRKQHGRMVVTGFGSTPRGQKYIKREEKLTSKSPKDPKFKQELTVAVKAIMGEEGSNGQ